MIFFNSGVDIVEVAPAYDTNGKWHIDLYRPYWSARMRFFVNEMNAYQIGLRTAESTTVIAANIVHELIEMMIHDKPPEGFRSALRRTIP